MPHRSSRSKFFMASCMMQWRHFSFATIQSESTSRTTQTNTIQRFPLFFRAFAPAPPSPTFSACFTRSSLVGLAMEGLRSVTPQSPRISGNSGMTSKLKPATPNCYSSRRCPQRGSLEFGVWAKRPKSVRCFVPNIRFTTPHPAAYLPVRRLATRPSNRTTHNCSLQSKL